MLRAVAALAVVVHHTLEQSNGAIGRFSPNWLTTAGASGVDIFFVISGFIMLHVSFRPGRSVPTSGDFLFRRATRIFPFYWICCLAVLLLSSLGFLVSHKYGAWTIFVSFLLLPGEKLIGVSWTLVFEVYFYLLFAFTLWFRSEVISLVTTTAAILVIFLLAQLFPAGAGTGAEFLANPLSIEFCFGLGLAHVYAAFTRNKISWPTMPAAVIVGLIILIIAPVLVAHPSTSGLPPLSRILVWGVPAAMIVAGSLSVGAPKNAVARYCVLLGNASYALYLTHIFVMIGYGRLLKVDALSKIPQLPIAAIIICIAIVVGVLAHLLVEKPVLGLIRRLTHREPGHAAPAQSSSGTS